MQYGKILQEFCSGKHSVAPTEHGDADCSLHQCHFRPQPQVGLRLPQWHIRPFLGLLLSIFSTNRQLLLFLVVYTSSLGRSEPKCKQKSHFPSIPDSSSLLFSSSSPTLLLSFSLAINHHSLYEASAPLYTNVYKTYITHSLFA